MLNNKLLNQELETAIEIVEGLFQEEGYQTKRFSKIKGLSCTEYDIIILKNNEGKEFSISFSESVKFDKDKHEWQSTKIIGGNE